MENLSSELSELYEILHRELRATRLEHRDNIRLVPLYRENRAETDSEECFNPIGQACVNSAIGFWCYTRLFYDKDGRAIRKVPVGKGSWNLRETKRRVGCHGREWCKRILKYGKKQGGTLNFKMIQHSLGGEQDQPEYAICQIFPTTAPEKGVERVASPPRTAQRDLLQNDVAPPGTSNHPPSNYENPNGKRKLEIWDPDEQTCWTIDTEWIVDLVKRVKPSTCETMHDIHQPPTASPYGDTEEDQSTMPFCLPPQGEAGISNERADPSISHKLCKSGQDDKLDPFNTSWDPNDYNHRFGFGSAIPLSPTLIRANDDPFQGMNDLEEEIKQWQQKGLPDYGCGMPLIFPD